MAHEQGLYLVEAGEGAIQQCGCWWPNHGLFLQGPGYKHMVAVLSTSAAAVLPKQCVLVVHHVFCAA